MSLVDDGLLGLDDPVGLYLPEWNSGAHAQITLRMCFAHTSGLPANHPAVFSNSITLRQAALQLAVGLARVDPGDRVRLRERLDARRRRRLRSRGGTAVVGALPAADCRAPRHDLDRLREPRHERSESADRGGAQSNARDFAAFMSMLRRGGSAGPGGGPPILSREAVGTMLLEQTANVQMVRNVHPDEVPYGLGIWIERQTSAGITLRAAAAGAFGFTGWVDWAHDSSGVFSVQYQWPLVYPTTEEVEAAIDDALLPNRVSCLGTGSPSCAAGTWLTANAAPTAGDTDFALRVSQAPSFTSGWIAIGDPDRMGLPLADMTSFVGASPVFAATAVTDGDGRAIVPLPLSPSQSGTTFALQSFWRSPDPCTARGAQASHAIVVVVP